jgi:hypothetical protein
MNVWHFSSLSTEHRQLYPPETEPENNTTGFSIASSPKGKVSDGGNPTAQYCNHLLIDEGPCESWQLTERTSL